MQTALGAKLLVGIPLVTALLIALLLVRRELPVFLAFAARETAITGAAALVGVAASRRKQEHSRAVVKRFRDGQA